MAIRRGPSDRDLERYLEQGLSYQEIADMHGVAKGTIASLVHRAGLSSPRLKYRTTSLWSPIHDKHQAKHDLNMLRAREMQLQGERLTKRVADRLAAFLDGLAASDHVIAYAPDTDQGFWHLDRNYFPAASLDPELPIVLTPLDAVAELARGDV